MSSTKCDGLMMMMTKACCVDPTKWDKGKIMMMIIILVVITCPQSKRN
jgi:hypothetical protein